MLAFRNGQLAHKIKAFHEVYGETVRVAPNEVSFINPDTVKDIYQRRPSGGGFKSLPKDPIRQAPPRPGQPISILDAGDADHTRLRKAYAAAFSSQALSAQEPLVASYVDKMIAQMQCQSKLIAQSVDLQEWISFCTFDIVCKLSFGEDFGCLDNQRYHEWVGQLVHSLKAKVQLASCRFYPWLFNYLVKRLPKSAGILMAQHQATTKEKVKRRLQQLESDAKVSGAAGVIRPDFLAHLVQQSRQEISEGEMVVNAATLIVAGSHTLQTAITGILFHLLQNPTVLNRVTSEVRGEFPSTSQINVSTLLRLPMLEAAIKEGIRLTSPVPLGLTRLVPIGGHTINGEFFPEGVSQFCGHLSRYCCICCRPERAKWDHLDSVTLTMNYRLLSPTCNGLPMSHHKTTPTLRHSTLSAGSSHASRLHLRRMTFSRKTSDMLHSRSCKARGIVSARIWPAWRSSSFWANFCTTLICSPRAASDAGRIRRHTRSG